VDITGLAVYTCNPPGGAFRGFGVPQSIFASEMNMNLLAEKVGITPWEMRYRNAIRPGEVLPNGQIADESTALVQCLEAVKDVCEKNPKVGLAASFKNSGLGVGVPDTGRCKVSVEDGKVHVRTSAACIGQGMATIVTQVACQTTGLAPEMFVTERPDTRRTPNSGTTTASRQTLFTGEATRLAALQLKQALDAAKGDLSKLEGQEFSGEYFPKTDAMGSDVPNPVSHVAYGYAAQVVVLREDGKVEKVIAAYDVGTPVNVCNVEGQIEGGVAMGLGYAFTEDFVLKESVVQSKYGTLGLMRSTEVPPVEVVLVGPHGRYEGDVKLVHGNVGDTGPASYGSKGVGELSTIPTAPAAALAYYNRDGEFRTKLPLEHTAYKK
jgi:CO/xanthine dehydrogenase Mo-binding subunit